METMVQSYLSEVVWQSLVSCILHLPRSFLVQNFSPFHRLFEMFGCHVHSRMNTISKDPSVFITCRFYCICKNMFMFSFAKSSAFWICNTALFGFYIVWYLFKLIMLIIPRCGRCWRILLIFIF